MIPQIQPFLDERDVKIVSKYLRTTWVTEGPATADFENGFRKLTKSKHCLAYCNGTMALFSALKTLNIGEGDEVIAPSTTFIATINAIILTGATPVIIDVDYNSLCMDPKEIEKNITKKTKAIMPVQLYGVAADMEKIMKIAKARHLRVIEDAAQGVGVRFSNKHVGTFGDIGCFSFYGNKTMTMGEGGMLVTDKKAYADAAYRLKNHGRIVKGTFKHETIGYNFSISDLQSALGVSQLSKLAEIIKAKKHIYDSYRKYLDGVSGVAFCKIDKRISPVHWFTNILVKDAPALSLRLKKRGVQTRLCFYPIKRQPCYKNFKNIRFAKNLKNDDRLYKNFLSLPSWVGLKDNDVKKISDLIKSEIQK